MPMPSKQIKSSFPTMHTVKAFEPTLVLPSHPPFQENHLLSLSHLDTDHNLNSTVRYLRVYVSTTKADDNDNCSGEPFRVISKALSAALVHYYPLAGILRHRHQDQRLVVSCNAGQGVPFVSANADCTLEQVNYLDDADPDFLEKLVPDPNPDERMVHPCMLQVTMFECGGFTLGTAMHNSICDGLGAGQFFTTVAELARGATEIKLKPIWDREKLLGPRNPPRVEASTIRSFFNLDKGFSPYKQDVGNFVRKCFHVKDELVEQFKSKLEEQSGLKFTTFEALGAYIWRSKVEASGVVDDKVVKFAYLISVRKLLRPPLPVGYWGNGCVVMYVQLRAKDLVEKPIWETAELIQKSKSNVNDEYVRSFIDFQELHFGDGITAGKGVNGFTDWRHLGHSSLDFGWGGPVNVLPLSRNLLGSVEPCFFLPYSTSSVANKDGFKVLINLAENALPAFQKDMELFAS